MKRLSKEQETRRVEIVNDLGEKTEAVLDAVKALNLLIENELAAAIIQYNEAVSNAKDFRAEIVGEMESYTEERSEKWHEGAGGQNYEKWKSSWEYLDTTELDSIDPLQEPDMDLADELEQLDSEPQS